MPEIMSKPLGSNGLIAMLIVIYPIIQSSEFGKTMSSNTRYADLLYRIFITLVISVLLFSSMVCFTLAIKAESGLQSLAVFCALYSLCLIVILNTKRMKLQRMTLMKA